MSEEGKIKGFIFDYVMDYVKRKWGIRGIEKIGFDEKHIVPERWYPIEDFLDSLHRVDKELGSGDESTAEDLAYTTMIKEERWRSIFKDEDPKEVFSRTKYQDKEYLFSDFSTHTENDDIIVEMVTDVEKDEYARLWSRFYLGQLKAVHELCSGESNIDYRYDFSEDKKKTIYTIKAD